MNERTGIYIDSRVKAAAPETNTDPYGPGLRERRKACYIGLRRFAEAIGVLPSRHSAVECGREPPYSDPAMQLKIERVLAESAADALATVTERATKEIEENERLRTRVACLEFELAQLRGDERD